MEEAAVEIEGLTKIYPGKRAKVTAVEDISLSIAPGEIFGLLGPNGAGKTTTVRMMCGLLPPTAGTIRIDGLSVHEQPDAIRSHIGLLPEDAGDYRNLTLDEELEFHGALHGLSRATVRQRSGPLLDRLGLKGRTGQRLQTYSRGMRRKFHLIRTLLHRPRVLLLDEPTAGLDPSIVEEVWDLLKELASEHRVTVVLCSHHLEEIERLCSRIAIIRRRLLIAGSLAELSGGDNQYTLELASDAAGPLEALRQSPGVHAPVAEGNRLRFSITGTSQEIVPELVRRVVAAGGAVLGLNRQGQDLRSLYRSFTDAAVPEQGAAHE